MIFLKTTILVDDDIYKKIVEEAIKSYGSAKNISAVVNKELKFSFAFKKAKTKPRSFRGKFKLKNFSRRDLLDLREKKDRIDQGRV